MHPLHRLTYLSALAVSATLLLACTSPDATPTAIPTVTASPAPTVAPLPSSTPTLGTPTPTPALPPLELIDGWPRNAVGPLLVFIRDFDQSRSVGPSTEVVLIDLGTGAQLDSFPVGRLNERVVDVALAGLEVVVNLGHGIEVRALDGSRERALPADESGQSSDLREFHDIAVSPDGSVLAVAREASESDTHATEILLVDVATGDTLLTVPATHPGLEDIYLVRPTVWRDDGAGVLLDLVTNPEAGARVATVMLDGSIRSHDTSGFTYPAPNGRRIAHGTGSLGCMFISGHSITLTDLDTDTTLATIEDPTLSFNIHEWSPDSTELLYATRLFPSDTDEVDACEWPAAEPSWFVVGIDGSPPTTVASPLEARLQWKADYGITFRCQGVEGAGWHTRFDLLLRPPDECITSSEPPALLLHNGVPIAEGQAIRVLGFIEPPDAATKLTPPPPAPGVTSIPEVDTVVEAVFVKDSKALANLIRYTYVPCSEHGGVSTPPSCDSLGVTEGTPIEVLLTVACDGYYAPPGDATWFLSRSFGDGSPELYFAGLYQPSEDAYRHAPVTDPDYVVIFRPTTIPDGWPYAPYRALTLKDGHIVAAWGGCDLEYPPDAWVARWIITPEDAAWHVPLADTPALVDLTTAVLSDPKATIDLTQTIEAYCSFHGELLSPCEARGLTVYDHFEAVVVSDLLHCEACEVPPENVETSLSQLYATGGVSTEQFWGGVESPAEPSAARPGVELVAAWELDHGTRELISERWQGRLTPTHALAFKSPASGSPAGTVTGFLLFVDPAEDLPIANIEPTSNTWSAFDTAEELGHGAWQPLYLRP